MSSVEYSRQQSEDSLKNIYTCSLLMGKELIFNDIFH